ncbi:NAD-P-binding protein [Mycena maculata]|uniref:NAD-P-binding protein n=1 Tax=Mycena maculata TaxID=230809 RepID=A0AAD7NTX3_9AGAR|nr:NAD-P-binding protein [Mycena maculata]
MPARKTVSEDDLVDLHGKVVLVTGGNTGIGYATIQMLARRGAKVYMGARDQGRAEAAIKQLETENINDGSVHWLKLDLSDPRTAKAAANEFLGKEQRLDILVNNAAIGVGPFKLTNDGLLDVMVTNHFSPFVLTDTLLPLLKETAKESSSDVRIVNVSSMVHAQVKPSFSTKGGFNQNYGDSATQRLNTYGNTKLANLLHIKELQKRLNAESIPITCLSLHPGTITTSGSNAYVGSVPYIGGFLNNFVTPLFFGSWRQGAMTVAFAAAGKDIAQERVKYQGAYLVPVGTIGSSSGLAQDERMQKELYETTQTILADLI